MEVCGEGSSDKLEDGIAPAYVSNASSPSINTTTDATLLSRNSDGLPPGADRARLPAASSMPIAVVGFICSKPGNADVTDVGSSHSTSTPPDTAETAISSGCSSRVRTAMTRRSGSSEGSCMGELLA